MAGEMIQPLKARLITENLKGFIRRVKKEQHTSWETQIGEILPF